MQRASKRTQARQRRPGRMTEMSGRVALDDYVARVRIVGKDLTAVVPTEPQLFDLFSEYRPTGAGIYETGAYGWVCLPSLDMLDKFIEETDGHTINGNVWRAFADCPAVILLRTGQQLLEAARAESGEPRAT
ncbi:hypothetical protein F4802DRAFT_131660 [Xylaria palmicola]|nr:hypothetical protein F4802DRAFT_131660 [Xylaria palmicola]